MAAVHFDSMAPGADATAHALARAARIKLMIFDVDGVLTDGAMQYGGDGEAMKTFNVHDGLGIIMLQQSGVQTAIISARNSPIVTRRAADLRIGHVLQGAHDKRVPFAELLAATGLTAEQCGFIGDDVIDLPILTRAGFAASVPNGRAEVHARVHHVTAAAGGHGAVREICEFVMRAQGTFDGVMAQFLA